MLGPASRRGFSISDRFHRVAHRLNATRETITSPPNLVSASRAVTKIEELDQNLESYSARGSRERRATRLR